MRTQHWYNALTTVEARGWTTDPDIRAVLEFIAYEMGRGMDSGKNAQGYGAAMFERSLDILDGVPADSAQHDDDESEVSPARIAGLAAGVARLRRSEGRTESLEVARERRTREASAPPARSAVKASKAKVKCAKCGKGKTFGAYCASCGTKF